MICTYSNFFHLKKSIFVIALLGITLISNAQVNRRNVPVSNPYRMGYQRVAAGFRHVLEIRNGQIWAWGNNSYGQFGDGSITNNTNPVPMGGDSNWVVVSGGDKHSLGIKANGTLWAWGNNRHGQLGLGTTDSSYIPVQVGNEHTWISVVAGANFSLALKIDGTLWAWGENTAGQLGDGTTIDKLSPVNIGTEKNWSKIEAGVDNSFAINTEGNLWVWGSGANGKLGDGTIQNYSSPHEILSDSSFVYVAAGADYTLALKSNGTLWAWGQNNLGQMGAGILNYNYTPLRIGTEKTWVSIDAARGPNCFSIGLKVDGTLWTWGDNTEGQLGLGTNPLIGKRFPTQVGLEKNWVSITAGASLGIATKSDGYLWYWGQFFSNVPLQGQFSDGWISFATMGNSNLGVRANGTMWAMGSNSFGQLGIGNYVSKNIATQIGNEHNWLSVNAGNNDAFAIKADGTLWCWGVNSFGQLGNGTFTDAIVPQQLGTDNKWVSIAVSEGLFNLGLKSDGTLWAWGVNNLYQLGDGTTSDHYVPVQIGSDSTWVSVSVGTNFSMAIKADGSLWAWGFDGNYNLGVVPSGAGYVPVPIPQRVGQDNNWVGAFLGYKTSSALKSDGTRWAVGVNDYGEFGNGTSGGSALFLFTQVDNETNWLSLSVTETYINGLKADGTLWGWAGGWTGSPTGLIGDGTTNLYLYPTQVMTDDNWVKCLQGLGQGIGTKGPRRVFCAVGNNSEGSLGNCSNVTSLYYVCSDIPSKADISLQPQSLSVCTGSNASFSVNTSSGSNFQWQENGVDLSNTSTYSGVNTNQLLISNSNVSLNGKKYACLITGSCVLPASSDTVQLTVNALPQVSVTTLPDSCKSNGAALAVVSGGTAPFTYSWSNGASAANNNGLAPGTYSVTITDASTCTATGSGQVGNTVAAPVPICLATVDTLSRHNIIIWEKPVTTFIDSFRIYREDITNVYSYVASVDYNQLSQYTDTAASVDPIINSRRYKMAIVDNCGQVSGQSKWHNTILLQDQQNGNFNWNFYEVENQTSTLVNQYILQRYDSISSSWIPINNTAGTQNSMVAPSYFLHQYAYYRIQTDLGTYGCTPTARIATGVNNTRSNIKNKINPNAIYDNKRFDNQVKLQPNPATDRVQISSGVELESIRVVDYLGQEVLYQKVEGAQAKKVELSVSVLASGLYMVVCKGKDFEVRKKLIVK